MPTTTQPRNTRIPLPPLPTRIRSVLGWIKVKRESPPQNSDPKEQTIGYWNPLERTIQVEPDMDPVVMWQVLCHEWAHSVIFDAGGSKLLEREVEEYICDAFGTALAVLARHGKTPF